MKKALLLITLAVTVVTVLAQQIRPVQVTSTVVPQATWTGSNAQLLAVQLLNITNVDGSAVAPTNFAFPSGVTVIVIRVSSGTNGVRSITAQIH